MDQSLLALADGTLIYTRDLSPGEITILRSQGPRCGLCGEAGDIVIPDRPMFRHQASHPPDEPDRRRMVATIARRLGALFPDGQQQRGMEIEGAWADLGLIRANGARLVVRILSLPDASPGELQDWRDTLEKKRTEALFLLDAQRLPTSARTKQSAVRGVQLRRAETDLLAMDEPLLYIEPAGILRAVAMPEALRELARHDSRVIGKMRAPIRLCRPEQLEIRDGSWFIDPRWMVDTLLPPEITPTLQARIEVMEQEKTDLV